MSIYNKPHVPRPMGNGGAGPESTTTPILTSASTIDQAPPSPSSSHSYQEQEGHSSSSSKLTDRALGDPSPPLPPSSTKTPDRYTVKSSRQKFPFAFPLLFSQSNTPSASVAPSTAQGKPIPLADTSAVHRTSALQKLNSTYPSADPRHRSAKSSGAQNSTYLQPVIVRTYSGPPSPRHRPSSTSRGLSRRVPLASSTTGSDGLSGRLSQPELSSIGVGIGSSRDASSSQGVTMPRQHKSKKGSSKLPIPWQWIPGAFRQEEGEEPKLPPLDAFSFKSFMADMQTRGGDNDIGADLDRIAEICARSRYSLSNQYEVHVAPHGSGASFVTGKGSTSTSSGHLRKKPNGQGGPSDDDEGSSHSRHRRRNGGRRRSTAYGTLETIMSSSRSSEEDKSKKKPAAEIASEVRGRAVRKAGETFGSAPVSAATENGESSNDTQTGQNSKSSKCSKAVGPAPGRLARKKSASFANAIMKNDSTSTSSQYKRPAAIDSALLSDPALPQASNSHLGVRTAPRQSSTPFVPRVTQRREVYYELPHEVAEPRRGAAVPSDGWSSWVPWSSFGAGQHVPGTTLSHAEGSLRQLLRSPAGDV